MTADAKQAEALAVVAEDARISIEDLAVHLDAAAVWLRQLALAGERPAHPVELKELLGRLNSQADELTKAARTLAEVDQVITDGVPLAAAFGVGEVWGAAAVGAVSPRYRNGPLPTVLTHWQILHLRDRERRAADWNNTGNHNHGTGIAYLDGLDGVPGIGEWESEKATERRAVERQARIHAQALALPCERCHAFPGGLCHTNTGRQAELMHRGRVTAATALVDGDGSSP